jgi:hypothetical protein
MTNPDEVNKGPDYDTNGGPLDYGDDVEWEDVNRPTIAPAAPRQNLTLADEIFMILERELDVVETVKQGKIVRRVL